jgi:hypothetical protein
VIESSRFTRNARAFDGRQTQDAFIDIDGTSTEVRRLKHQMWCAARDRDVTVLLT